MTFSLAHYIPTSLLRKPLDIARLLIHVNTRRFEIPQLIEQYKTYNVMHGRHIFRVGTFSRQYFRRGL